MKQTFFLENTAVGHVVDRETLWINAYRCWANSLDGSGRAALEPQRP